MKYKTIQHYDLPNQFHELTFSCFKNQDFFRSEVLCGWFTETLEDARKVHSFKLLAYVIMPTHVHLLIYPTKSEYKTSKILSGIKIPLTRRIMYQDFEIDNDLLKRMTDISRDKITYRFWQRGGGYDRNIISKKAVIASVNYIHANPVRKGLVDAPEEWFWSSAGFYAGRKKYPIKMDEELLECLV
jgi:putative transposase